jgi:hypothetical protein
LRVLLLDFSASKSLTRVHGSSSGCVGEGNVKLDSSEHGGATYYECHKTECAIERRRWRLTAQCAIVILIQKMEDGVEALYMM